MNPIRDQIRTGQLLAIRSNELVMWGFIMGKYLDLWDVSDGHPRARQELINYRKITAAAVAVVKNPAWEGICDEDIILEKVLHEAGELDT